MTTIRYCKKCEIANEWCPVCDVDAEMDAAMQYVVHRLIDVECVFDRDIGNGRIVTYDFDNACDCIVDFLERVEAQL